MKTIENKYAELDTFLNTEIYPDALANELTELREQCVCIFMNALIYEEKGADMLQHHVIGQLYYLRRIIEILSKIKNN